MKPLLTAAILTVVTLVFGATLAGTCHKPASSPPPFAMLSTGPNFVPATLASIRLTNAQTSELLEPGASLTNSPLFDTLPKEQGYASSKPMPLHLGKLPLSPTHLSPGVHQTHPYAMILIVPGRGIDDGILKGKPDTCSRMPRIKPHMDVTPKVFQP